MPIKPAKATKPDNKQSPAPQLIYRMNDLTQVLGLSQSLLYKMVSEDRFPKPVELGPRAVGWRVQDVQAWVDALPQTVYVNQRRVEKNG